MGYIIVGAVCLVIGAIVGLFIVSMCVASKNRDYNMDTEESEEDEEC